MTNRLTMLHGYAMGILILIGSLVLPQPADAVPAFARQTSMPCTACHFQHFPTLNSFGRSFRAGGYTLTGGQGMIEGDDISLPLMLNASVITKLRYVKSNGNTNVGSDYGVIEWPDEAALLVGGKLAKDAGFLMELGLTDANSFLSTKVHFNVGKAGGTQFSVIPFSTDGLGSAYGFELLNTGAQRSQRPIEDRTGFSAAQALGLGSGEATGIALVASSHNFFINYTPWVPGWEENNVEVKPSGLAHYLRAAYTPFIGSWDTGFGFQLWSGDAEVADGAGGETLIATDGWVVDGQMQGSVGSMPLGIYASFGSCSADESHFLEGCTNTDDGEAFGILAQLGILPNKANVFAAYRALDDGSEEDSEFNSTTVGLNYLFSQNIRFELFYVKESGDGVDARDNDRDSKWLF
ncbi:MAG: hypothetical protein ABW094_00560, partial [Candidatus Thiodiazotropha sp.]